MHEQRRPSWKERFTRSGYFWLALLFHVILFLLLATIVIWDASVPPVYDFKPVASIKVPPPPPQPPSSGDAAKNPQFEPQSVIVPTSTPQQTITSINSSFTVDTSKVLNQSLSHLTLPAPQGSGLTAGSGGGGVGNGSGMTAFGSEGGVGLVGTLYDMKQTPDRKPTDITASGAELNNSSPAPGWENQPATQNEKRVLHSFLIDWDMSLLDGYYKAPIVLQAVQIFIPKLSAAEAPKAFHVEDTVQPRRWIVIYKAKIIPPKTGEFRFIGFADDFLVVRIGQRNVLDGSWRGEQIVPTANVHEDVGQAPQYAQQQPLYCGKWIDMEGGVPLDMQVLIGEGPGGQSSFFLMIQEKGVETAKGDYPVFQLKDVPVPSWTDPNGVPPACTKQKMVFGVAPVSN